MSLSISLNSSAAKSGISGPLWFAFSREFGLALASWLNASAYGYSPLGIAPPAPSPISVTGSGRLQTFRVRSPSGVSSGPLGVNTERAILDALVFVPMVLKPLGSGSGSGVSPILPSGSFRSSLGPLGGYLVARVGTLSGPVGKSWLLDFGTRLESGMSFVGTATVISQVPVPVPVIVSVGVICPL